MSGGRGDTGAPRPPAGTRPARWCSPRTRARPRHSSQHATTPPPPTALPRSRASRCRAFLTWSRVGRGGGCLERVFVRRGGGQARVGLRARGGKNGGNPHHTQLFYARAGRVDWGEARARTGGRANTRTTSAHHRPPRPPSLVGKTHSRGELVGEREAVGGKEESRRRCEREKVEENMDG